MNSLCNNSHVRLRAMEPEDLDMLYRVENDMDHWQVGATNVPYSRYVLHDYIAKATGDIYTDKQVRLMMDDSQGGTVGMVDLVNFDPKHCRAEVSIIVAKEKRRQGYARAALSQVKAYAKQILHLHQLYAIVEEDNAPSVALFESAGFCSQCTLPQWLFDGEKYNDAILMQSFL